MDNTSHHYSLDFEPNYVFVNGEALLRKHWTFTGPVPNGRLDLNYDFPKGATVVAAKTRSCGYTAMRLNGEAAPHDWDPRIAAKEADERERKAKVTRAVDHMVDKAGFTLDQTMAISALFTAMIESHEETWGK